MPAVETRHLRHGLSALFYSNTPPRPFGPEPSIDAMMLDPTGTEGDQ